MPSDPVRVTRALLSVSDKAGLIDFARALAGRGVALVSTGGTHRALAEAGLSVTEVSDQVSSTIDGLLRRAVQTAG